MNKHDDLIQDHVFDVFLSDQRVIIINKLDVDSLLWEETQNIILYCS